MNSAPRQGMIPQSSIGQPQAMLSMGNPSFSMQNPVPLGTQQPMGMPQNNPPMTILSGGPVPTLALPRYPLPAAPMQGSPQQPQRQMVPRPSQNGSHLNPAVGNSSASHIQSQLQTMPFPSTVMQGSLGGDNGIRRVQSQPQININSLAGMSASVTGSNMGMNQQTPMPGQLRQAAGQQQNPHQLHQMRIQHQQQQQQQQMIPQNIDLMIRNQGTNNMSARMAPAQGQVMGSLAQPPLGSTPLPASMPPSHQNAYNGSMPPVQLTTSPRPTSTQGMPMGTPVSSHAQINRPRTSPDSSNALPYMNYSASQFPGNATGRGIPSPGPSSYPFVPATSPRMQMPGIPQTSPPAMMPSQSGNPSNKTGFFPTPAQQRDMYNPGFSMPPPSIPNQLISTPLQQPPLPSTPQTSSLPNPQQQRPPQPSPSPQQQIHQHQVGHPIPPDQIHGLPHAQSQGVGGAPGAPSTSQPPRGVQHPASSNAFAGGLTAAGRLPLSQQTQGSSLSSPSTQQSQVAVTLSSRPSIPGTASMPPTASSSVPAGPLPTTSPPPGIGVEQASGRGKIASGGSSTYYNNQQEKQGMGLMRLLQFSGALSAELPQKHNLSYWNALIREYFTPTAIMRLTLWKDNQRIEAKPFEIGVPILPRFFLVTTQSGVKSMTLSLDSARERTYQTGHTVIECVGASWTYRYRNGYTVTLRGPLTAHVIATSKTPPGSNNSDIMYRFEEFQFDANYHDKFIALESILGVRSIENLPPPTPTMATAPSPSMQAASGPPSRNQSSQQQADDERKWEEPRVFIDRASLPGEPVNAFGIPQATMRCLELAESVTSMAELIQFAMESSTNDFDMDVTEALKKFAIRLRDTGAVLPPQPPTQPSLHGHSMNISHPFYLGPPSAASSTTFYSASASPLPTHSMPPGMAAVSSPPTTTPSGVNSPEKQPPKTIPHQAQQSQQPQTSSAPSSSPAMSTASAPAAGTLKRKQTGDATSPTIGNEQQPQKRIARKRGRTGTG